MVWLNALLAFSLAMIVFCTIVSAMTEALQRIFHMRPAGLRRMIEQLFDEYLWPQLQHTLRSAPAPRVRLGRLARLAAWLSPLWGSTAKSAGSDPVQEAAKKAFLDVVTKNPAVEPSGPMRLFGRWLAPRQLDSLTVMQFVERTAQTEVGAAIRQRGAAATAEVVDELARRFSRLGEGASLYFSQRAKMMSVLLAVALAFAVNIDAIRLLSAFMTDQQLAQQIIAQADAIKTAYETQSRRTEEAAQRDSTAEDVKASIDNVQRQAKVLEHADQTAAFGLPVGSRYFPLCIESASTTAGTTKVQETASATDPACERLRAEGEKTLPQMALCMFGRTKSTSRAHGLLDVLRYVALIVPPSANAQGEAPTPPARAADPNQESSTAKETNDTNETCGPKSNWYRYQLLAWFASVALAGLLIGLGGPFWFDAFAKLSSAVQILRGLGLGKTEEAKQADAAAAAASAAPASPATPTAAFLAASGSAAPKTTRILLGPDGAPLLASKGRTL